MHKYKNLLLLLTTKTTIHIVNPAKKPSTLSEKKDTKAVTRVVSFQIVHFCT